MAGLIEQVTERDLPRSRNTLDDDDEADAAMKLHLEDSVGGGPVLRWSADGEGDAGNAGDAGDAGEAVAMAGVTCALVTLGSELREFVLANFAAETGAGDAALERVGTVVVPQQENGKESGQADALKGSCGVWRIKGSDWAWVSAPADGTVAAAHVAALAQTIVDGVAPAGKLQSVVVLGLLSTASYMHRAQVPLVRAVASSAQAADACKVAGVATLEAGNVVTGLAAALLTECRLSRVPEGMALLSLREPSLEPSSLTALTEPLRAMLQRPAVQGVPAAALRSVQDTNAACASIREARAADREVIYV